MILVYLEQSITKPLITLMLDLPAKWASVNSARIWVSKQSDERKGEGASRRGLCLAVDVWELKTQVKRLPSPVYLRAARLSRDELPLPPFLTSVLVVGQVQVRALWSETSPAGWI